MTLTQEENDYIVGLQQTNPSITPAELLEIARDEKCPVHGRIEWDTAKAARKYQLNQCRYVLASARMVTTTTDGTVKCRVYLERPNKRKATDQGYVSMRQVMSDEELAKRAIEHEFRRLMGQMNRLLELAIVLGFEDQVRNAIKAAAEIEVAIREVNVAA